ncbi:MAG: hypothetical protein KatS3mg083_327 [Candidatus Dojkabacteria bacterium]|nr:MAG: hypothetical protein KatS3mg083_327 [Candidatus Dojkabacteria bacterium]
MKSEIPETTLTKIARKIGWLFSPLLFLSLLTFTILSVNNLRIDFNSAKLTEFGHIHLRDVSNFDVYLNDTKIGTTSQVLNVARNNDINNPFKIYIKTADNRYWEKNCKIPKRFCFPLLPYSLP